MCTRLLNNTRLFQQGDYARNPMENSQVGVRYHGIAPFGMEFTLNYFYQRFDGANDGTNSAPLKVLLRDPLNPAKDAKITAHASRLFADGIFPAEAYFPYVHTLGVSANYSDEAYTQAVFRFESIYDIGVPFFDVSKVGVVDTPALPGVTKKDMWKGMMAFDRPTWIKWLNKKSTWFLTGQFFWHHLLDNHELRRAGRREPLRRRIAPGTAPVLSAASTCRRAFAARACRSATRSGAGSRCSRSRHSRSTAAAASCRRSAWRSIR